MYAIMIHGPRSLEVLMGPWAERHVAEARRDQWQRVIDKRAQTDPDYANANIRFSVRIVNGKSAADRDELIDALLGRRR